MPSTRTTSTVATVDCRNFRVTMANTQVQLKVS